MGVVAALLPEPFSPRRPPKDHTMSNELTVTTINDEARILDTDLAEALGYANPIDIRKLIRRHEGALVALGFLATVANNHGGGRGRPAEAFYLTKKQALFIVTQCRRVTGCQPTSRDGELSAPCGKLRFPAKAPKVGEVGLHLPSAPPWGGCLQFVAPDDKGFPSRVP